MRREPARVMLVPADRLESFAADLLQAGGFAKDEAAITAKSLILSNLMGHDSHGMVRATQYTEELKAGSIKSTVDLKILNETAASLHADAQSGLGQVQMPRLLEKLFDKIGNNATVTGTLCDCGHVGRLGEWVELAASKGYAAFMAVNDNGTYQIVAPHGGIEARTSTNPLAFAIPMKDGDHFSIDLSTSATAMGKVRLAHLAGETMPDGLMQDHKGKPTNNPSSLYNDPKGTLLPFGGHKGFALSMMIDLLVSGLSGGFAPPAPIGARTTNNVMICLWNPQFFSGIAHMQAEAGKYIAHVKATRPVNPNRPVRIPGERAKAEMKRRLEGGIPVDQSLVDILNRYARKMGVTSSPFLPR